MKKLRLFKAVLTLNLYMSLTANAGSIFTSSADSTFLTKIEASLGKSLVFKQNGRTSMTSYEGGGVSDSYSGNLNIEQKNESLVCHFWGTQDNKIAPEFAPGTRFHIYKVDATANKATGGFKQSGGLPYYQDGGANVTVSVSFDVMSEDEHFSDKNGLRVINCEYQKGSSGNGLFLSKNRAIESAGEMFSQLFEVQD